MKRYARWTYLLVITVILASCPAPFNEELVTQVTDEKAPSITLSEPSDGTAYGQTVTVRGSVNDDGITGRSVKEVIRRLWYRVGTTLEEGEEQAVEVSEDGSFQFSFSTSSYNGTILLTVGAEDWNGNDTRSQIELLYPGNNLPSFTVSGGNRRVFIHWEEVEGADSYTLYYTDSGSAPTSLNSVTAEFSSARTVEDPLVLSELVNGTLHAFRLEAASADGSESWSSASRYTIPVSPYTFTPLVYGEVDGVHLEWPEAEYLDSFTVERRREGGSWSTLAGEYGDTVLFDSSARPGTFYEYRVTPVLAGTAASKPAAGEALPFKSENERLRKRLAVGSAVIPVVEGQYLYYFRDGEILTFDISDPERPREVDRYAPASFGGIDAPLEHTGSRAAAEGDYIYFSLNRYGLGVLDISTPDAPQLAAIADEDLPDDPTYGDIYYAYGVEAVGNYAYVLFSNHGLRVFDVSTPASPKLLSRTPSSLEDAAFNNAQLEAVGEYLYATFTNNYVLEYFIGSDKADDAVLTGNRLEPASGELGAYATGLAANGDYLALADWGSEELGLFDVSSGFGSSPAPIAKIGLPEARRLRREGEFLYASTKDDRLVIIDVSNPNAPVLLDEVSSSGMNQEFTVRNGSGYVSSTYFGLEVYDLSPLTAVDFTAPYLYTGVDPAAMITIGRHALIADGFHSDPLLQVLEIGDGGSVTAGPGSSRAGTATSLAVHGELAFAGYQDSGGDVHLEVYRWSPSTVSGIGRYTLGGSVPVIHDLAVYGDAAYAAVAEAGIFVFDVSDPAHPALNEVLDTGAAPKGLAVRNGTLFAASDYYNGSGNFSTYGLSEPLEPQLLAKIDSWSGTRDTDGDGVLDSAGESSDTLRIARLAVNDDYAYLTGDQRYGLIVFDVSDPSLPAYVTHMPTARGSVARPIPLDVTLIGESVIYSDWDEENGSDPADHRGGHHVFRGLDMPRDPDQALRYQYEYYLGGLSDSRSPEYATYADGRFFYRLHGDGLKFYPLEQ
jgi:hypothetical protein